MDSLYTRYANALLSIAIDEDKVDYYRIEIKNIRTAFLSDNGIINLLSSAFIDFNDKEEIINNIYKGNDNVLNFMKIIVRNRRANVMIKIFNEFIKKCNETLNIKDGYVYSVRKLTEEEIEKIEDGISEKLASRVELENIIDEKLIGGVKVLVEDKIFDGSIKTKIEKLKESLIKGGA
ncbi:MAG: F0F1 ATP synthase subunit delta [Bacilli bacterium]|jgi:F-type H+-transporting ATPase subunit delta|nr:F0F1 ATP synthase subunit delta [Bacilli bacterium]